MSTQAHDDWLNSALGVDVTSARTNVNGQDSDTATSPDLAGAQTDDPNAAPPTDPNANAQPDDPNPAPTTDPSANAQPDDPNAGIQVSDAGQQSPDPNDAGKPAGGPQLTSPQIGGASAPQQAGLPPNLQLHFQLSAGELAACNQYLDAHFSAAPTDGSSPILQDSYKPALDGKPVTIDDVVTALVPFTTAAMSKDGSDQLFKDATSQLYDLVNARYAGLVLDKTKAVSDAATKNAVQDVNAASSEAEAWMRNYLKGNNLRPPLVDDGTGQNVLFDDKTTPFTTMVSTAVAAGHLANLQSGDMGRSLITEEMVTRIARDMLAAAVPTVPKGQGGGAQGTSLYLQYTFTPTTVHTPVAGGADSSDQPAHSLTGQMTWEFHGDNQSGLEISAFGQLTWFADDKGGHIQNQSGFAGAQVAWVWSFLDGNLQAGPLFQTMVGASRAQQKANGKLDWTPTGQVAAGGQIQYAIPGLKGHLLVGVQATGSATDAKGADGTLDRAAALTLTFKL